MLSGKKAKIKRTINNKYSDIEDKVVVAVMLLKKLVRCETGIAFVENISRDLLRGSQQARVIWRSNEKKFAGSGAIR
jgi:hypothetical protein